MPRRDVLAALAMLVLVACGEPALDVNIPERQPGQHVADLAGVLTPQVQSELDAAEASGLDVAVLTFETPQASCGEAFRAARELVDRWQADVAVVAVARPGDFLSEAEQRRRCVGVQPRDDDLVAADVRERIAERVVPPLAAENDWDGVVLAAVDELAR